jgi:hypothetical protein
MRRISIAAICCALIGASALVGASTASAEGCHEGVICVFQNANYTSAYYDVFCSSSGAWSSGGVTLRSATNRCGNKTDWLRTNGTVIACMNPGGNRPSPGNFNEVFVAAEYGAFC